MKKKTKPFPVRLVLRAKQFVGVKEREGHVAMAQLLVHEAGRQPTKGVPPAADLAFAQSRIDDASLAALGVARRS